MSLKPTSLKAGVYALNKRFIRNMSTRFQKEWRFAPVDFANRSSNDFRPKLRGIIFDVDGTLCKPQNYMFREMREALGISKSIDILEHIESLQPSEQNVAQQKIQTIERQAMEVQTPQPGLVELMDYLDAQGIPKGLCTRNFDEPVDHLLKKFLPHHKFSPILTRSFKPPKPDPAGILAIAREWSEDRRVSAEDFIMVGDSVDDTVSGSRAKAFTIALLSEDGSNHHLSEDESTDCCITRLDELISLLDNGGRMP